MAHDTHQVDVPREKKIACCLIIFGLLLLIILFSIYFTLTKQEQICNARDLVKITRKEPDPDKAYAYGAIYFHFKGIPYRKTIHICIRSRG